MEHQTITIRNSENGRLIYCKTCENYQLDYKIVQLTLTVQQLDNLVEHIGILLEKYENLSFHEIPQLIIPTLTRKQHLVLTYLELIALNQLLTGQKTKVEGLAYNFSVN